MLLYYELLGIMGSPGGGPVSVVTPASRRIVLSATPVSVEKAEIFSESMDPYELMDFEVNIGALLDTGETIDNYSVALPAESGLLGLTIVNSGAFLTTLTGNTMQFWLSIISAEQQNLSFSGTGITLPITVNITTSLGRKRQRTVAVRVNQR